MDFEEAMRAAARIADDAVTNTMADYAGAHITDEDDVTPYLLGSLKTALTGQIGGLTWEASVARHRKGIAAEEQKTGADFLIHVHLETPTDTFSKGVLVQAKRFEPGQHMSAQEHDALTEQCNKMLQISASSFVFDYAKDGVRVGSATRVEGADSCDLHSVCNWTSYRFFLELFRCPIGDPRITSALVDELPIPQALALKASGEFRRRGRQFRG